MIADPTQVFITYLPLICKSAKERNVSLYEEKELSEKKNHNANMVTLSMLFSG